MNELAHKIGSLLIAVIVLFSTISFTVEKHYCNDKFMGMSVLHGEDSCDQESSLYDTCCNTLIEKSGCCSSEHIVFEGQDALKFSWESISLEDKQFLVAFTTSYFEAFTITEAQTSPFDDYAPPLIIRDIQLLNESFLI